MYPIEFNMIVMDGGHVSIEVILAAARMDCQTPLLTRNVETLGQMSYDPSIGGIGKGHLAKEAGALGGTMAIATDESGIQFCILNFSKGPAVRATRVQADHILYKVAIRHRPENQPNLMSFQQTVKDLLMEGDHVVGAVTQVGMQFHAYVMILTAGTFLGGEICIGLDNYTGDRAGSPAAVSLSTQLKELKLPQGWFETDTLPCVDGHSINFSVSEEQPGDLDPVPVLSLMGHADIHSRQAPHWVTHTNERTHDIIRAGLDRSPMYTGVIEGVGPRYCPSTRDRIHRFASKDGHQIFLGSEGLTTNEFYLDGMSTSLPFDVQLGFIHSMCGLESAHIPWPRHIIKHDYFDPRMLKASLESKAISGLFSVGQTNGMTSYGKAVAQGLLAGINADLQVQGKDAWTPRHDQACLGALIDDLITQGVIEPYRMSISRTGFRLSSHKDSADMRLIEVGHTLGVVDDACWDAFNRKRDAASRETECLRSTWVNPATSPLENVGPVLGKGIEREYALADLLRRPNVTCETLMGMQGGRYAFESPLVEDPLLAEQTCEQVEIDIKHRGYIAWQTDEVERPGVNENTRLSVDFDYPQVHGLSIEVQQKLVKHKSEIVGRASRISDATPTVVLLLLVCPKKGVLHGQVGPRATSEGEAARW